MLKNRTKELWKDIEEFEGFYQISNKGNVRSLDRYTFGKNGKQRFRKGRLHKPGIGSHGYKVVGLRKGKGLNLKLIHRLVAIHFIPNPENKPCVNHIKGIKTDNRAWRLEWVTYKENNNHATKTGLKKSKKPIDNPVQIKQFTLDDKFIKEWYSITEAATQLNIYPITISLCVRGIRNKAGGFKWKKA